MIKGRVTAIVASYNHAEYLKERMDSLVNQTWKDLEILVIDDCSTDNSLEVLRPYTKYPQVKLIENQKNSGWVKVSNQGIEMATGEFIVFANCDDYCKEDQIEKLVAPFSVHNNLCAVFSRNTMVDEKSNVIGDDFEGREKSFKKLCSKDTFISGLQMSKFLFHSCVIPNLSQVLIKTSALKEVNGLSLDFRACSDWDIFFKLAEKYDFYYLTEELNSFRQHKTTIRKTTKDKITYDEFYRLLSFHIKQLPLGFFDNIKYTFKITLIWAQHLFSLNPSSYINFWYHFKTNLGYYPLIVILLPFACIYEFFHKLYRIVRRLYKQSRPQESL